MMRAKKSLLSAVGLGAIGLLLLACGSPYEGEPEKLVMPKQLPAKPKPPDENPAAPPPGEPDICKTNFEGDAIPLTKRQPKVAKARSQDAENAFAIAESDAPEKKRADIILAMGYLKDALKADPYSPQATYDMAVAYAMVGKKRCSLALLERLGDLAAIPENAGDVTKMKAKAKKAAVFEPFRADADGALGQ